MKILAWICLAALIFPLTLMAQDAAALRKERDKLVQNGMWRDALTFYEEKLLPISDADSGVDLLAAIQSVRQLNAWNEFDAIVERAVAAHPENPGMLRSAAQSYHKAPHAGRLLGGDFERGQQPRFGRGPMGPDAVPEASAGAAVDTSYRDRVRAWQLLRQALAHAPDDDERHEIWNSFAWEFTGRESWKLQILTPLDTLPEWGEPGPEGGTEGAPWGKDGPVLYEIPKTWEAAKNDGERWRFSLAERARLKPALAGLVTKEWAEFSRSQFGVETLASFGWWRQIDPESAKGILEVETLAEDEVLAKTSDGVRRFKLPAEHHFIALYRSLLNENPDAGDALTQVFLNRRQRDKARELLEKTLAKHGPSPNKNREKLLKQITGNWGRFEPAATVSSGTEPVLPLVFRNATAIQLSAAPVDMDAVIADTIAYLKSQPRELEWERLNPAQIAQRLISGKGSKYIGKATASWEEKLSPREKYHDTRADLVVPVSKSGAWWITGELQGGNSFHTLVWIVDSVIAQNDVAGAKQWWLADAESGAPVAGAELEFFGYRTVYQQRQQPAQNRLEILTRDLRRQTDADGKTLLKPGDFDPQYQWLAIARKEGSASAFYGFQPFSITEPQYDNHKRDISYGISDRPLYKPGDTAHLKFYLRNVSYVDPDESRWANQTGTLTVMDGRGEEVVKLGNLRTDALGAVESELVLPANGALGTWQATFQIADRVSAYLSLRVEEYRKPEYEVKVEAPDEPVKLGDKFTATIKATYFHGAPVRNANVEIIVKRGSLGERWFPVGPWDWLYGAGAWWTGSEARWHPTWDRWGCIPPHPPWWQQERWTPDELVLKTNIPIGSDGIARLEIDTATAKAIHGDMDARYTIEARVVDASRREERATGTVIAARKPFEVVVWTSRGYTRAGEEVEANISAATLAGKPVVAAKGTLKLYQLSIGEDGRVGEKEVQSWLVETDDEGKIRQDFAAPASGQYRLAASLAFRNGEAVEGATILNVHGPGRADPADWRFGPLELVSDKPTHAPGETLKLRVNSDRADAHVWLFLHVAGSSGREARRIQLDGKSLEVEVPLDLRDMPNMFIEGISIHGAQVHTAVRQVLLPPVSRLIEVTLEAAKERVKPREKSALRITLRDAEGKPVTGTAVLTIYDKALEAITGGSNVGAIHQNFWSWKNNYYPHGSGSSLPRSPGNLLRPKVEEMQTLGRFGDQVWTKSGAHGGMARGMLMESDAMAAPMLAMAVPMEAGEAQAAPGDAQILVRKDFADLLKWSGSVQTDANGSAEIPLEFPDNLTTWKARVWVLTSGTQVGEGTTEIITSKELLVRLQAPRFLIERDESVFSAVVQNDHDTPKTVKVSLELDGDHLQAITGDPRTVEIAAKSEARVDWVVKALREGEATLRMRADAGDDGDAVERKLPVHVHGMRRQDAWSRVVEADQEAATIEIEVPEERRPDQSKLTVRFSPSIAGAVVDAIPYLAGYPHESTEQTVNRFVPAVIAQKMLKNLDIKLAEIKAKRANLNPQELGHPADRAAQWKQWQGNPVFDELELEKMVARGVDRLMSMQNADGGWGWFSGFGERSYPHTTAVVVHGLLAGRENGAEIPEAMLNAGIGWLMAYERRQTEAMQLHVEREALRKEGRKIKDPHRYEKSKADALDAFVRMVLGEAGRDSEPMLAFLHRDRLALPVYAKCLLGLEHHRKGDEARRDEVMRMISQFLKRDPENQTAYLDLQNRNFWWLWYGSDVEAHAWYLKLLAAVKPNDPDTRGLVKYLVNNRKHASYWNSTRDTAYAIEAIAGYFKASGEDAPDMEVEVLLDGKSLRKVSINRENLFTFDGTVLLTGDAVASGKHQIELRRSGKGTLYANAYLEVFTLEDKLRAAGLEVKVSRRISKLIALEKEAEVPDATGLVTTQTAERFRRELLEDGAIVASGDRIEVELILESKNDYEYLVFSDSKAAGFEAIDALSGYISGGGFSAYMEPRDRTVDFFIRALPRGSHTLRYQLRAETPGIYKALPAIAQGMYAPELRGNSDDIKLEISDRSD